MRVYALVGPTGTGKSYRAPHLAAEHGIECIIDDGLLIVSGKIVAGRSAKAELSKIKAAKVAVFYFPDHREEVQRALRELRPEKILVLGISLPMVEKICERLELPPPEVVWDIFDLAPLDEIQLALVARESEGKHTIPVPLVEVKRNLWGTIADALPVGVWRWFYASREKTVVRPPFSYLGKLVVSENALRTLVFLCLVHTPWVRKVNEITLHRTEKGLEVELSCVLQNGSPVSQVCRFLQQYLKERIEYLTGVELKAVHMDVEEVVFLS
ncbi:MAG: Asp23/Gls24 family envelope stress response protein [Candidatus Caldatribacterium sp.]|nr:Asp23/Gls24 family envelope stress response protein [Candidatus Caldatribacterium sp.]